MLTCSAIQEYFRNIVSQLLTLLRTAAEASIASTISVSAQAKGKAPLAQPPPTNLPLPILRATCYLLAHLLVRPALSSDGTADVPRRIAREVLQDPLLPETQSARPADMSPDQLAVHLSVMSLLSLYSPPLPTLLASLVRPVLPPLLSLLSHLAHPPLIISEPSPRSDALRNLIRDEANALVQTAAKGLDGPEAVVAFAAAVERWEVGEAFGRVRTDGSDRTLGPDTRKDVVWRWRWSAEGTPALCQLHAAEAEEPAPSNDLNGDDDIEDVMGAALSPVDITGVVSLLKAVDRKELSAGLLLRWLDELKTLRSDATFTNGISGAVRAVTRLQLVLQMVEELDAQEIVRDRPKEIIAFVAHALDIDGTAETAATASRFGAAKGGDEGDSRRPGLAGSAAGALEADDPEGGLGTGLGRDEMALTALTLLLAVLEGVPMFCSDVLHPSRADAFRISCSRFDP